MLKQKLWQAKHKSEGPEGQHNIKGILIKQKTDKTNEILHLKELFKGKSLEFDHEIREKNGASINFTFRTPEMEVLITSLNLTKKFGIQV